MAFVSLEYNFNAGGEPPTGSQVRLNNVNQAAATKVWINYITSPGADMSNILPLIQVGDVIALQDFNDGTKYVEYSIVGAPVDKGTYVEYAISFRAIKNPLLAQKIFVFFATTSARSLPPGGDTSDVLSKLSPADFSTGWVALEDAPVPPTPAPEPSAAGPCESWDAIYPCDVSTESPDCLTDAVAAASTIAWALSGRQFGLCTVTLRPCAVDCTTWAPGWMAWSGPQFSTWPLGWYWPLGPCGDCPDKCSCSARARAQLPYPVHDVVQVRLDGSPMVTGAYRVDDNRTLVRTDGGAWPTCNDLTKPITSAGTWDVTARYGLDPPLLGKYAVGELACEFVRAFRGEECQLPKTVTHVVRQGVRLNFADVGDLLRVGRTGLYITDMFIASVNPGKLKRRARVFSVDDPTPTRVGT
jgi:hypothetical protein